MPLITRPAPRTTQSPAGPTVQSSSHVGLRVLGIVALAAIAVIHLKDLPSKLEETPYLAVAYIGLIIACVGVAVWLAFSHDRRAWLVGGGLAAATFSGYVLSRSVGLPAATDDIGNWGETLGILAQTAEATMVGLVVYALLKARPFMSDPA